MSEPTNGLRSALPAKFWKQEEAEGEGKKISKVSVGYIHRTGTDYRCRDCVMFIPDRERCLIHSDVAVIKPNGYCIYWAKGRPYPGLEPKGSVSKLESGYGEDPNGTTCAKCEYFDSQASDCKVVDKNSPGDDIGSIHPKACCANQEPKEKG